MCIKTERYVMSRQLTILLQASSSSFRYLCASSTSYYGIITLFCELAIIMKSSRDEQIVFLSSVKKETCWNCPPTGRFCGCDPATCRLAFTIDMHHFGYLKIWSALIEFDRAADLQIDSQEKHPPQQQSTDTHVLLDVTCNMLLTGTDKWILQTHRNHQVFQAVYMRLVPREGVQARGQTKKAQQRGTEKEIWVLKIPPRFLSVRAEEFQSIKACISGETEKPAGSMVFRGNYRSGISGSPNSQLLIKDKTQALYRESVKELWEPNGSVPASLLMLVHRNP
ncbi:hypothetical protein Anapl_08743 [Anas platyrhynchos]|uniref:Uncharacterized protein n=1 Tax=Anas platyrhynchos TaxID=8839 RepID=R0LIT4_ANAPL|nr:hypothetical protein Anapl_08743 [Anas platyrhynchos]